MHHAIIENKKSDEFTHVPWENMVAISQTTFSNAFSWMKSLFQRIQFTISEHKLVLVMAWDRIGDKPLPESMLIQFTDAYMRH